MESFAAPQTAYEYITCFRQLAAITSSAIDSVENTPPVYTASLDRIAHSVETLACLRGDSAIYSNSRPEGLSEYQNEMHATEEHLRTRLLGLGYTYPTPRSNSETI